MGIGSIAGGTASMLQFGAGFAGPGVQAGVGAVTAIAELGKKTKVVATGGLSSILHPLHQRFDEVKRHLTLDGLRLIHQIVNKDAQV